MRSLDQSHILNCFQKPQILFYYDIPIHGTSHNFQSYTSYCKLKTALHLLKQFRLFLMKGYFNHIDITAWLRFWFIKCINLQVMVGWFPFFMNGLTQLLYSVFKFWSIKFGRFHATSILSHHFWAHSFKIFHLSVIQISQKFTYSDLLWFSICF